MLQNLSEEICECVRLAEECKRSSKTALTPSPIKACLDPGAALAEYSSQVTESVSRVTRTKWKR